MVDSTQHKQASIILLREVFEYDPNTGVVRYRSRPRCSFTSDDAWSRWNTRCAGKVLTCRSAQGYIVVNFLGKVWVVHRVAWAVHHGDWPSGEIDHINGDRSDNRIVNLRDVSPAINQRNTKLDRRNKSGVSGVRWRADRSVWESTIRVDSRVKYLGQFPSFDAAVAARKLAERENGFHENHGRAA